MVHTIVRAIQSNAGGFTEPKPHGVSHIAFLPRTSAKYDHWECCTTREWHCWSRANHQAKISAFNERGKQSNCRRRAKHTVLHDDRREFRKEGKTMSISWIEHKSTVGFFSSDTNVRFAGH